MHFFFLKRGKEGEKRERNIDVREKHQLVASLISPQLGTEPAT